MCRSKQLELCGLENKSLGVREGRGAWCLFLSNVRAVLDKMVFSWYQGLELGLVIKKSRGILILLNIMKELSDNQSGLTLDLASVWWKRDDHSFTGTV